MQTATTTAAELAAIDADLAALEAALAEKTETKLYDGLELKAVGDFGKRELVVRILGFNRDSGGDRIEPTALDSWMATTPPSSLSVYWHHRVADAPPLGVVEELQKDAAGVVARIRVFATERGNEILAAAKGLIVAAQQSGNAAARMGSSIGYYTKRYRWEKVGDVTTRVLEEIGLREMSLCGAGLQMNGSAVVLDSKTLAAALEAPALTDAEMVAELRRLDNRLWRDACQEQLDARARGEQADEMLAELAAAAAAHRHRARVAWLAEAEAFAARKDKLSRWDYQQELRRLQQAQRALQAERDRAGD